jgi:hypothetical protein
MTIAGFFSDGIDFHLPHPSLDDSVLLIAHNAICCALALLRTSPPSGFALATAHEDEITRQLGWVLENRLRHTGEVPGFDERVFRKVCRAPEVTNFDGKHPAKRPDLVFDLARDEPLVLSGLDALFVECKPVGKSHPISTHYCNKGTSRFIVGDYGWAMQEGMMLAYVRHGQTLLAHLGPILGREPQNRHLGNPSPLVTVFGGQAHPFAETLYVTTHQRNFQWPQGKGKASAIRIFHSWHDCSS